MVRYEIRAATLDDEPHLAAVARHLDTVNLPNDEAILRGILQASVSSFDGSMPIPERRYLFVLFDHEAGRIAGTSMVVTQLGRRDAPYIYVDVTDEQKYSAALDKHFHHQVLRVGYSYDGPTEIGGLVVVPEYRNAPERLGLAISYVRFLYIAAHRDFIRDEILAELMPPLAEDGTSHLWEAFGRRFTGMSYREADLLSSQDKRFIRDLFPSGLVYSSLFSPEARAVIGEVGPQTKGVENMLRRIGFRFAERVDPFDGGPHFIAETDEISLVQETVFGTLSAEPLGAERVRGLLAREYEGPPWFRALIADIAIEGDSVRVDEATREHLDLSPGARVLALPFPTHGPTPSRRRGDSRARS